MNGQNNKLLLSTNNFVFQISIYQSTIFYYNITGKTINGYDVISNYSTVIQKDVNEVKLLTVVDNYNLKEVTNEKLEKCNKEAIEKNGICIKNGNEFKVICADQFEVDQNGICLGKTLPKLYFYNWQAK